MIPEREHCSGDCSHAEHQDENARPRSTPKGRLLHGKKIVVVAEYGCVPCITAPASRMGVPFGLRHVASGSQILLGRAAMCSLPWAAGVSPRGLGLRPSSAGFRR